MHSEKSQYLIYREFDYQLAGVYNREVVYNTFISTVSRYVPILEENLTQQYGGPCFLNLFVLNPTWWVLRLKLLKQQQRQLEE